LISSFIGDLYENAKQKISTFYYVGPTVKSKLLSALWPHVETIIKAYLVVLPHEQLNIYTTDTGSNVYYLLNSCRIVFMKNSAEIISFIIYCIFFKYVRINFLMVCCNYKTFKNKKF